MNYKNITNKNLFYIVFLYLTFLNTQLLSNNSTISGYVVDRNSNLPLVGANIFFEGTSIGSASNDKGFYELKNIKIGSYIIKVSYIGYKTFLDTINISEDLTEIILDFKLDYTSIQGNEITVTSQAKGQMEAINKQLNSKSLVNIISSERIHDLPDANAVETIARAPGVSIKREGGEGNKVVIRGLSPKYNNITVNGVKIPSTDNDNRSTDLSMISQYMIENIEVIKAGTPDMDGEVLGGTVNLELKKAKPGFHGNIVLKGMHNGLRNTYSDNKFVFDISKRFWRDRVGVLGQIDSENRNRSSHEIGVEYNLYGETIGEINPLQLTHFNLNDWYRLNDRDNVLQVFDIKIPSGNITYNNLKSKISKDITHYRISYGLLDNGRGMISGDGFNNISILSESWKYEQTLFKNLKLSFLSSYSKSNNESGYYIFNFGESFAYSSNPYNQNIKYIQQIAKNDTSNMLFENYNYRFNNSIEKEHSSKFDLKYDYRISNSISGSIKFGKKIKLKTRTFDMNVEYGSLGSIFDAGKYAIVQKYDLDSYIVERGRLSLFAFIDKDYNGDYFLKKRYTFGAVADLDFMMDLYNYFANNFDRLNANTTDPKEIIHHIHQTNSQVYDYSGEEKYDASYFMLDIDFKNLINVIAGLRNEKVITTYFSQRSFNHPFESWMYVGEATSHKRNNSIYLPALFIIYKPTPWLVMRGSHNRTLTRPDYQSIIPLERVNALDRIIDWRNKFLKPGVSNNFDISFSLHQHKLGLMTLSYFKKDIKDLIFSSESKVIFPNDTLEFELSGNYQTYKIFNFSSNSKNNVNIKGIELDYQTRLWYLPGLLNGLVFNANYTLIKSKAKYPQTILDQEILWDPLIINQFYIDTTYTDRLLDQPNEIINFSIGYDYDGFSGRLSMLYNDDVFMRPAFWQELRQRTDPYIRWDLSIKQKLPINGISIYFNMSNITETNDVNRYMGETSKVAGGENLSTEQYYGKTIDLGFRYAF